MIIEVLQVHIVSWAYEIWWTSKSLCSVMDIIIIATILMALVMYARLYLALSLPGSEDELLYRISLDL